MSETKCTFRGRFEIPMVHCAALMHPTASLAAAAIDSDLDPLEDLVLRAHGVDSDEDALEAVVIKERRGLLAIDFHAMGDGVGIVVGSALDGGPPQHASDELVFVGPQLQGHGEWRAALVQRFVERAG